MSGSFVSYSRLEAKRLRKKGRARDKGNRQGLAKYFFQKVSLDKGRNRLRRWKSANIGGRGKGS